MSINQAAEPNETAVVPQPDSTVTTLVVFGKSPARIALMAGLLAEWMTGEGVGVGLAEVAHTLNHHRAWHAYFATVCARSRLEAVAGLTALAAGRAAEGVVGPRVGRCGSGNVFVYSGQGSEWAGMGRRLLLEEPRFAAAIAALEPVFIDQVGFSLRQVIAGGEPLVGDAQVQPALMGLQLALTELWRHYGMTPDAVVGHSMGEVTAAVVAGALSPADGLRVIAARSRLMARVAGRGAAASEIERILPKLRAALANIVPNEPVTPFVSTVSDAALNPLLDAEYWVANLREPLQFREAIATAGKHNATFIEISPHPILTCAIAEMLGDAHHHSIGTLRCDGDDVLVFHANLNAAQRFYEPRTPHPAEPRPALPTLPRQRTRLSITRARARRRIEVARSSGDLRRRDTPTT
jgi:acyl transferase domain-containing protein